MTAAVLVRPPAEQEQDDDRRWFELTTNAPVAEQLVFDRDSGLAAVRESGNAVAAGDTIAANVLDEAWATWFGEASSNDADPQTEIDRESPPESLHIVEARLELSRSYVGGGAMRLRRARR